MKIDVMIPHSSLWEKFVAQEGDKLRWGKQYILCADHKKESDTDLYKVCDGTMDKRELFIADDYRQKNVGFRPVFIPETPETRIPDGTRIPMATLLMDDVPVPMMDRVAINYKPGAKLRFVEPMDDPQYQIFGVLISGVFVADRIVLMNVCMNDLLESGITFAVRYTDKKDEKNEKDKRGELDFETIVDGAIVVIWLSQKGRIPLKEVMFFRPMLEKSAKQAMKEPGFDSEEWAKKNAKEYVSMIMAVKDLVNGPLTEEIVQKVLRLRGEGSTTRH